jgi:nitrogen fixation protein NifB
MKLDNPLVIADIIDQHPCFSEIASHRFGRIHLPVAPKCNIQCNYCERKYDCVNESRPGVTSKVISPQEAVGRVKEVIEKFPNIRVVGIAGPGDPLFNEETFETFRLIKDSFPYLHQCMSTNGLLLPEKVESAKQLGIDTMTVTLNAVDPSIGAKICSFIHYWGKKLEGVEAAEVLLNNQLAGIKMAVKEGIVVKVNTVMIPTINDNHIIEVAKKIKELGVYMQNIMPLIPLFKFAHLSTPSPTDRKRLQGECAKIIKQMTHCRQCRADAVGLLGKDMSTQLFG